MTYIVARLILVSLHRNVLQIIPKTAFAAAAAFAHCLLDFRDKDYSKGPLTLT